MVGTLARKVHLPTKHTASVKMLCLLAWLGVTDTDSGTNTLLPPSPPGNARTRPLTQSALTVTKGT